MRKTLTIAAMVLLAGCFRQGHAADIGPRVEQITPPPPVEAPLPEYLPEAMPKPPRPLPQITVQAPRTGPVVPVPPIVKVEPAPQPGVLYTMCTPANAPFGPEASRYQYEVMYDTITGEFTVRLPKHIVHYAVSYATAVGPFLDVRGATNRDRPFRMRFVLPELAPDGEQFLEIGGNPARDECGIPNLAY